MKSLDQSDWPELVARAQAGDKDALEKLLKTLYRILKRRAERRFPARLQAKGSASDVVQETLLEIVKNLKQLKSQSPGQIMNWFEAALDNNVRDFVKRFCHVQARNVALEVPLAEAVRSDSAAAILPAKDPNPSAQAIRHEQVDALQAALNQLPAAQHRVLTLHYQHGLTTEAIALRLATSTRAIRQVRASGRRLLDEFLRPQTASQA
jgi:RNA polymerase sigma-70 factor (ECF subfamily)